MFLSTYEGGLDANGRVSIPAAYRALLGGRGCVLRPIRVLGTPCLEGVDMPTMEALMQALREAADTWDDARQAMALTLFPDAVQMMPDTTGRISLPRNLIAHAHLQKRILFVGVGDRFHIWASHHYVSVAEGGARLVEDARHRKEK